MQTLSLLALILSAATLVVTILIALRLKTVHYLLQQPVVKKISPQLRLKPVKLDEAMNRPRTGNGNGEGRREGRENREGREGRESRDGRREGRSDSRNENGRREGRENREGREGRREGRENREGREHREGREPRAEGRSDNRDHRAPRDAADTPVAEPSRETSAAQAPAGLPPRRPPLPSVPETPAAGSPDVLASPAGTEATFVGQSDDVQHGRRTQLKKKPRFDIEDETPSTPSL